MKPKKRIRIEVVPARVWDYMSCRVVPGWRICSSGAIYDVAKLKSYAVAYAVDIAERVVLRGGTAELYIRNRAGKIVDRRTHPRSSDPRRSKG